MTSMPPFQLTRAQNEIFRPFCPTWFGASLYALPEQDNEKASAPVSLVKNPAKENTQTRKRSALAFVASLLGITPSAVRGMTASMPLAELKFSVFAMLSSGSPKEREEARAQLGLAECARDERRAAKQDADGDDDCDDIQKNPFALSPVAGSDSPYPGWRTLSVLPKFAAKTSQKIRHLGLKLMNTLIGNDEPAPAPRPLSLPKPADVPT